MYEIYYQKKDVILFDKHYFNPLSKMQRFSTILKCETLVVLVISLFGKKNVKNVIKEGYPEINARYNNTALILFPLFIL